MFLLRSRTIGQLRGQISEMWVCVGRETRGKAGGLNLNLCHIGLKLHLLGRLSCARLAGGPVRKNCADVRKEEGRWVEMEGDLTSLLLQHG